LASLEHALTCLIDAKTSLEAAKRLVGSYDKGSSRLEGRMESELVTGSRRRRLLLAIPQVLLFGGMIVMLVVHPNAFTSALHSTRALVVNGVLLAGWLLLSLVVLPRVIRRPAWCAAVLTAVAVVALVVLVVPTLRDKKVVEEFPAAVAEPTVPPTTVPGIITPPTTAPPAEPVKVSSGDVRGIGHDASGTASIYRQPDGHEVVGLEGIDIEPGPDYRVIIVRGDDQESPGDGLELDALRGNQGTQYYEVPADTDPGAGWTVLIWCRAFGVPVANATQH
jgi:hypothetical protein